MTWDFCAEPAFQEKLGWVEAFVTGELRPLEHLLPTLSQDARRRAPGPRLSRAVSPGA
jgi:hypothetical protein